MIRPILKLASPGGAKARLSVLVLHRVVAAADPLYPEAIDTRRFADICRWVKSMFSVLPLDEALQRMKRRTLPERALAITFDDGYADNRQVAMPVLNEFGLPATVFVATGFLDGGCMRNDIVIESFRRTTRPELDLQDLLGGDVAPFKLGSSEERRYALEAVISKVKYLDVQRRLATVRKIAARARVAVPTDLMMTSQEVRELHRGGMQIGAHTVSHPILATLAADAAKKEMLGSKEALENLLGERVGLFAYPNGRPGEDYNQTSVALARELGFDAAVTSARGAANPNTDLYQIPRFTPWDRSRLRFGARMLSTLWASRHENQSLHHH